MTPGRVALFGYGRFGQALAGLLRDAGHEVRAVDPVAAIPAELAATSPAAALTEAEWVILAVPVRCLRELLASLRPLLQPHHVVLDVGSVKLLPAVWMDEILGADIAHASTHPLFGPQSLARGERPLRVVVCPSRRHPQAAERARTLFERIGCSVLMRDAAEHDSAMAETHALAFYIARALVDMGIGEDFSMAPPSFLGLGNMLAAVRGDAGHLFATIQQENPYAEGVRERFLTTLTRIHQRLQRDFDGSALAIPPSTEPAAQSPGTASAGIPGKRIPVRA